MNFLISNAQAQSSAPTADAFGFLLLFPLTRKLIFGKLSKNFKDDTIKKKQFIDGEFEEIKDDDERKL